MIDNSGREVAPRDQSEPLTGVIVASPDDDLSPQARAAVEAGRAASTKRAYDHSWEQFDQWCISTSRTPLPATSATITEYTNYLAYDIIPGGDKQLQLKTPSRRGLAPATIERSLAAIYTRHRREGFDLPSREGAKDVMRGYRAELAKTGDPRARQKQAAVATRSSLEKLISEPGEHRLITQRNRAMTVLGFAVAARVSELILINIEDVKEKDRGLIVSVYRGKVRKHTDVKLTDDEDYATEIVKVVREWIRVLAEAGVTSGPLFPRIDRHGLIGDKASGRKGPPGGRISETRALAAIRQVSRQLTKEGWWTGHSLRRGLVTASYEAGNDELIIAGHGGWEKGSQTLKRYIEEDAGWDNNALKGVKL
jgi:integrase